VLLGVGVTAIAFVLTHLVPGDPAEANLGQRAGSDPVAVQIFRERYGLDKPLPQQYVIYLGKLVQGDMGESEQSRRPVRADLAEYIPATAELALTSIVLSGVLGVGLGVLAALQQNKLTDQVLRVVSLGGMSMPSFWLALVSLYVFFYQLSWVPGSGRLDPVVSRPPAVTGMFTIDALLSGRMDTLANALQHLILPACVLAAFNMGLFTRFTRSAVLEVLGNDYVRTARAKGLPDPWPCAACGVATGGYGHRPRIRQRNDRHSTRGEHLFVARHRSVLVSQRDHAGPASDCRGHVVCSAGLYPGQHGRRRAVRGHRSARPADMSLRLPFMRSVPAAWLQPLTLVGLTLAGVWLVLAVLAPWVAPYDPLAQDAALYLPPSAAHPFGTDDIGRDVLSRVIWGARVSIPLAFLLVSVAFVIGGTLGALAAYLGGWVDEVVMRAADLVFAIPTILLAMAVVAALGPGLVHAVMAVIVVSWPGHARVVRSLVRTTMQSDYVAVARLLGASAGRALIVDVLPNVAGPVIVLAALDLGTAILLLSGLSFLGLGAKPPAAEWGSMVSTGAQHFESWWIGVFPGLAIVSVVLAFNFLGDSLRDIFDPQSVTERARSA
jgi:peptide/nickel transport system permease protein